MELFLADENCDCDCEQEVKGNKKEAKGDQKEDKCFNHDHYFVCGHPDVNCYEYSGDDNDDQAGDDDDDAAGNDDDDQAQNFVRV